MLRKILVFIVIGLFIGTGFVQIISSNNNTIYVEDYKFIYLPDDPGPYHIGYFKVRYSMQPFGTYFATIRYPAEYDGLFALKDKSAHPYPGIVIGNGFAGSEWNIKWIPKHLTSHGFVSLCFTPPLKYLGNTTQWSYGFIGGINKLIEENNRLLSPICDILDFETFGIIGLSMGGAGCIETIGNNPELVDSAVALAPAKSNSSQLAAMNISIPIQIQVGSDDSMVSPERVLPYYNVLISDSCVKEYLEIYGGNHIGFIDDFYARFAEWIGIDENHEIDFSEQRRVSRKYFTSWFLYYLKDYDEYYTFIFGDEALADFNSGVISDFRFNIP